MSACAWCLRYSCGTADCCLFNGEQCRTERRLEDLAYVINKDPKYERSKNGFDTC